jgi:hypothetical protein
VKASLGFAGFKCPLPVAELATFTALQTLTLDYNDFQGSTLDNLAKVCGSQTGCVGVDVSAISARTSSGLCTCHAG